MSTRMAAVVAITDAPELAETSTYALQTTSSRFTTNVLVDSGSTQPLGKHNADRLIRLHQPPAHGTMVHYLLPHLDALGVEFLAYFAPELRVGQGLEDNWDLAVMREFDANPDRNWLPLVEGVALRVSVLRPADA
jgi:hypothetical protein